MIVACLGDSITEGSPGETTWQQSAARKHPSLRFRNFGVYGQRTDEIASRFGAAVDGADAIVLQGGINDIAQGRAVQRAAENMRALVRLAKQRVVHVALANVLPWNGGWPDAEPRIRALNELLAAIADEEDVVLLDFHGCLEDPERPGRMRAEWTHADGDHPSVEGYRRLGEVALDDLLGALEAAQAPQQ